MKNCDPYLTAAVGRADHGMARATTRREFPAASFDHLVAGAEPLHIRPSTQQYWSPSYDWVPIKIAASAIWMSGAGVIRDRSSQQQVRTVSHRPEHQRLFDSTPDLR